MSAPLHIDQHCTTGVVVLELSGQLVADEDDRAFKERISSLIAAGSRQLLLDLRGVSYMDSGGAGALATALLHVARRGGALKLVHPSDRVKRVLDVTHLVSVFEVFDNEAAAVDSFGPAEVAPTTNPNTPVPSGDQPRVSNGT